MIALLLAISLCSLTQAHVARHLFPVWQDLDAGLGTSNAKVHSFEHSTQETNLHFSYSGAELHPKHTLPLLGPRLAPTIVSITCEETFIQVKTVSAEAAVALARQHQSSADEFVSGACPATKDQIAKDPLAKGHPHPFYRRARSVQQDQDDPTLVLVHTANAELAELFHEDGLKMRFAWRPPANSELGRKVPSRVGNDGTGPPAPESLRGSARAQPLASDEARSSQPPRRKLFLDKIGDFFDNTLGELISDGADAISGWFGDTTQKLEQLWTQVSETVKLAMQGQDAKSNSTLNLVNINYDTVTRMARNRTMPFYHAPWATCEDCYFNIDLFVAVEFEFGPGGVPKHVHAEAGGAVTGSINIKLENPAPPERNDHGNWHNLVPRFEVGRFTFMLGQVPVLVVVRTELNGAATIDAPITARATAGARVDATARFGVDWTPQGGWVSVNDANWGYEYWLPQYEFSANDAVVKAHVSPEILLVLWDFVPVVIKPKPFVGLHFGSAAKALSPFAAASAPFEPCADGEEYALGAGFDLGLGVEGITVPGDVPILSGQTIVQGADFGTFGVVSERGFEECGELCGGCLSRYLAGRAALEDLAYAASANKAWDEEGRRGLSGGAIFGIVVCVLLFVALPLGMAVFAKLQPAVFARIRTDVHVNPSCHPSSTCMPCLKPHFVRVCCIVSRYARHPILESYGVLGASARGAIPSKARLPPAAEEPSFDALQLRDTAEHVEKSDGAANALTPTLALSVAAEAPGLAKPGGGAAR